MRIHIVIGTLRLIHAGALSSKKFGIANFDFYRIEGIRNKMRRVEKKAGERIGVVAYPQGDIVGQCPPRLRGITGKATGFQNHYPDFS